jgi:hypothetical protein
LSSAILYLAIVGIWAVVLVPRWLRPSRGASRTMESNLAEPEEHGRRGGIVWLEEDEVDPDRFDGLAGPGGPDQSSAPDTDHTHHGPAGPVPDPERVAARASAVAAERRSRIIAARRRTLLTLLVLTAGAAGMAAAHMAAWWVIVPPAVMLAGFVLLLREAARIDAERARRDSRQQARSTAEPGTQAEVRHAPAAGTAPAAEPTAKIIDIFGRIGDQLYDQYADAEVRAIGD